MNDSMQGLFQKRKTRKFIGISNPQIRAEITENAEKDDIHIRPNPTCYQCRKLVEEIKRLRQIMREGQINSMHVKNPGWRDDYVEDPEQISPRVNAAFVYRKSRTRTEEIEQLRREVTRLQKELRLRSEEVYRLRGKGEQEAQKISQHGGTKPMNGRDHYTLGDTDRKIKSIYLQLYQREWNQAYAHQKHAGVSKETAHGNLLTIVQLSFSRCREMADEQLTQILNASTQWAVKSPEQSPPPHTTTATHTPQQTPPNTTTTSYNKDPQNTAQQQTKRRSITTQDGSQLSHPLYKGALSYQRSICDQLLPDVQQKVAADIMKVVNLSPALKSSTEMKNYINSCIRTAWIVAMEMDRLHLDNSVARFSDFDTVKYDYYDEELENFDYVVWPALFSENLQLIAKGVAVATSRAR
uniref:Uncharacterized protein LOC111137871 n=1 Tax=Crassostrea virginica TaxID=6565 RepID=A0A8B8F0H7_CRAVI|nr:uncharacterized protein LOC111137871 [Crassostrea virginica]